MKTLIAGGGLSGLALAETLETEGQDYHLLEARDRFGGRIMTERLADGGYYDMGSAWFWPGQPRIEDLITRLGLEKFDQFASGELTYEDESGNVHRGMGYASMAGSWRLEGGLGALTQELADRLPALRKQKNAHVIGIEGLDDHRVTSLADGSTIRSERIVLAMPPRLMHKLSYAPVLSTQAMQAMAAVPTWMAGQAKAIAVFDTPFWREAGLSGDAMSRRGPMVEIHDASPKTGGPYALFGFIGVPPTARADEQLLRQAVQAQLVRLFGEQAAAPRQLFLKDWAFDALTATQADAAPVHSHPSYGLPSALKDLWGGHLVLAGTEVARGFGGFVEGALEAAEVAHKQLSATVFSL
ncbi:MAG: NAD(P)/FAD-dependent oxidoreductase [Pseudomonadota bacterium]